MNNKFYVSLETAKLLKEKGYDIPTNSVYNLNLYGEKFIKQLYPENWNKYEDSSIISVPTKAEAIDWLESKGIVVEVNMNYCGLNNWHYILHRENILKAIYSEDDDIYFSTRLEAEEAAIIEACKFLENGN